MNATDYFMQVSVQTVNHSQKNSSRQFTPLDNNFVKDSSFLNALSKASYTSQTARTSATHKAEITENANMPSDFEDALQEITNLLKEGKSLKEIVATLDKDTLNSLSEAIGTLINNFENSSFLAGEYDFSDLMNIFSKENLLNDGEYICNGCTDEQMLAKLQEFFYTASLSSGNLDANSYKLDESNSNIADKKQKSNLENITDFLFEFVDEKDTENQMTQAQALSFVIALFQNANTDTSKNHSPNFNAGMIIPQTSEVQNLMENVTLDLTLFSQAQADGNSELMAHLEKNINANLNNFEKLVNSTLHNQSATAIDKSTTEVIITTQKSSDIKDAYALLKGNNENIVKNADTTQGELTQILANIAPKTPVNEQAEQTTTHFFAPIETQVTDLLANSLKTAQVGKTTQLTMTLNPENLGNLSITISKTADELVVSILAQNTSTAKLIEDGLPNLIANLKAFEEQAINVKVVTPNENASQYFNLDSNLSNSNRNQSFNQENSNQHFSRQNDDLELQVTEEKSLERSEKLWQTA